MSEVSQPCLTLCDPMDCSLPGSSVCGILQTIILVWVAIKGLLRQISGKEYICQARYMGSIPGSGRSPGKGNGNLLQYSCLGNPMDRGAWWATVHGVAGFSVHGILQARILKWVAMPMNHYHSACNLQR